ncbi:MAG TPA: bifunctional riboflavin kinase/FAD synthetase [Bacilli bacterium]
MKIIHLSYPLNLRVDDFPDMGQVLAIGYFDGVHSGHQEVIQTAITIGKKTNKPVSLMTFHPHPREVLGHSSNHKYLTPLEEKLDLFAQMGVDYTYIFAFDTMFSQVSPLGFIEEVLLPLQVQSVVVGFNFTFGHKGSGTPDELGKLSKGRIKVKVVQPFYLDGDKVSSTLIREQLQSGQIHKANELLGHAYTLSGTVVAGDGRGRTMGIPTANIEINKPFFIPGNGVYAVKVQFNGLMYNGVMNIGHKPTFSKDPLGTSLEVHILNFEGMIYDEDLIVHFISFLRHETKFASIDQLIGQIHQDIEQAKLWLV